MDLADKLVIQRKKKGISQEELADMLDVSRQSVSKWESAQCAPELNKLVQISEIYGVSLDYLLKDGTEEKIGNAIVEQQTDTVEKFSGQYVRGYLKKSAMSALATTLSVTFFILAPIFCLFFLYVAFVADVGNARTSVTLCATLTLSCAVIAVILLAVGLNIVKKYSLPMSHAFALDSEAEREVSELRRKTAKMRIVLKSVGTVVLLAAAGVAVGAVFAAKTAALYLVLTALIAADCGVSCFVYAGLSGKPYRVLDSKGAFGDRSGRIVKATLAVIYWAVIAAVFCANLLLFNNTEIAIAVIVSAAIIFFAVCFAAKYVNASKKKS